MITPAALDSLIATLPTAVEAPPSAPSAPANDAPVVARAVPSGTATTAVPAKPPLTSGAPGAGDAFSVLFALAFVIAMIVGLAWLLKRLQGVRGVAGQDLKVRGGVSVGTRERVVVVEANGRLFMLGVAPGSVRSLADLGGVPPVDATSATAPGGSPFAQLLRRVSASGLQS